MKPHVATAMRWLAISSGLALVWILGSQFLVQPLIEKAYHGQSHPLFNRVITGQEFHGLSHYLHYWRYVSRIATILILAFGVAGLLVRHRQSQGRIPLLDDLASRGALSVKQSIIFALSTLAVAAGAGILSSLLSTGMDNHTLLDIVTMERGVVQLGTFSFLALGTFFALLIAFVHRKSRGNFLLIAFLVAAYSCRELDFPIMLRMGRPTDKWKPFFQGPSSIWAKIWFALLILAIGIAIIALIRRKSIFRALARREDWAVYGSVWALMLVFSQSIDKGPVGGDVRYSAFEEPFELFAAAVCFLSIYSLASRDCVGGRTLHSNRESLPVGRFDLP